MNILIVSNMFPPIATGSSHYAADLAQTLTEAGHNVTVLTVQLKKHDTSLDSDACYKIVRLPALHLEIKGMFKWFTVVTHNPLNYFRYVRLLKQHKIDVVHQVNHYLDTAVMTRIVCKMVGVPYVCSIHTLIDIQSKLKAPIVKLVDRLLCGMFILGGADKIVALDLEIVRYLTETHGSHRIEGNYLISPHGIDLDKVELITKKDYKLGNLIVSIGHVIKQRNRMMLIKAMKKVVAKFPDVKLEIIGHVYIQEPLDHVRELGLEGNIVFRGEMSHNETLKRLTQADCHAVWIDSKYAGAGTAVTESMLCGVPVLNNSPESLLGELPLRDMKNYIKVDKNDPDQIADRILALMESQEVREKIGKGGMDFVKNHMDLRKVRQDLIDLYSDLSRN
ncbi:glycosyltransferase family 4 protein [Calditrichota bacterium]